MPLDYTSHVEGAEKTEQSKIRTSTTRHRGTLTVWSLLSSLDLFPALVCGCAERPDTPSTSRRTKRETGPLLPRVLSSVICSLLKRNLSGCARAWHSQYIIHSQPKWNPCYTSPQVFDFFPALVCGCVAVQYGAAQPTGGVTQPAHLSLPAK